MSFGQARQEDLVALAAGRRDLSWIQLVLGLAEVRGW